MRQPRENTTCVAYVTPVFLLEHDVVADLVAWSVEQPDPAHG